MNEIQGEMEALTEETEKYGKHMNSLYRLIQYVEDSNSAKTIHDDTQEPNERILHLSTVQTDHERKERKERKLKKRLNAIHLELQDMRKDIEDYVDDIVFELEK